jgi:hypothetical protein
MEDYMGLTTIMLILCAGVLFLAWTSKNRWYTLLYPVTLGLVFGGYILYTKTLGYATTEPLPAKFEYVWHTQAPESMAFVWVVEKGDNKPRAHFILLDEESKKKLSEAKRATEKGELVHAEKQQDTAGHSMVEYDFFIKTPEMILGKKESIN